MPDVDSWDELPTRGSASRWVPLVGGLLGMVVVVARLNDIEPLVTGDDGIVQVSSVQASRSSVEVTAAGPSRPADPAWLDRTSAATGIPPRALAAYASAELEVASSDPSCGIGWNTLAGIGAIESGHGSYGGSVLGPDGRTLPAIVGPALDGVQFAAIRDTDDGAFDGDAVWDRAVGPLQFIPSTWQRWGADGNGDGHAEPGQLDDAALAAAHYLCHAGPMTSAEPWRRAIHSYNHSEEYVDAVADRANSYADAARS